MPGRSQAALEVTWFEQRVSPDGHTGCTANVRLTLADMPWLFVTKNAIVYTPAFFMLYTHPLIPFWLKRYLQHNMVSRDMLMKVSAWTWYSVCLLVVCFMSAAWGLRYSEPQAFSTLDIEPICLLNVRKGAGYTQQQDHLDLLASGVRACFHICGQDAIQGVCCACTPANNSAGGESGVPCCVLG